MSAVLDMETNFSVAENAVPWRVTTVATGPLAGQKEITDTVEELWRAIDRRLPTAS